MRLIFLVFYFCNFSYSNGQEKQIILEFADKDKTSDILLKCPESFSGGKTQYDYYEHLFQDTINKILMLNSNFSGSIFINVSCKWQKNSKPFYFQENKYNNGLFISRNTKYKRYDLWMREKDTLYNPEPIWEQERIVTSNTIEIIDFDLKGNRESLDSTYFEIDSFGKKIEKIYGFTYDSEIRTLKHISEYYDDQRNGRYFEDFTLNNCRSNVDLLYTKDSLIDINGENIYFVNPKGKVISKEEFNKFEPKGNFYLSFILTGNFGTLDCTCNLVLFYYQFSDQDFDIKLKTLKKVKKTHLSELKKNNSNQKKETHF